MRSIASRFALGFALIVLLGIVSHVIGEALPRKFSCNAFPFASCKWEKNGAVYQKLHIRKWMSKLPDKSKYLKSMAPKRLHLGMQSRDIHQNIQESCVAELIHWILLLCSGLFLFIGKWVGTLFCTLYALSHVPYIMIQRYLRPQLIALQQRRERIERNQVLESTDFNLQYR